MGEELVWYNSRTWGVFGVVEKRQVVRSHTFETRDRIRKIECIKVKAEEKERESNQWLSQWSWSSCTIYERATRAKNTCVYSVYVFLIQQGTFSKQRITILSQNPNSFFEGKFFRFLSRWVGPEDHRVPESKSLSVVDREHNSLIKNSYSAFLGF